MKNVRVCYQMTRKIENGRETTETSIMLPMCEKDAQDLIKGGEESTTYLVFVHDILENLSLLQDHEYVGFCHTDIEDFARRVKETHGDNQHARDYERAIQMAKIWIDLEGDIDE